MDCTDFYTHTDKLKPYEYFQGLLEEYADLMNWSDMFTDKDRIAMSECGEWLSFAEGEGGALHLAAANFCRKRCCPMCMWRKSEKQFANCLAISEDLTAKGYRFLHLVLTVPNCENGGAALSQAVKSLYAAFGRFWAYKRVKMAFKGVLRCLEVSYNYDNHTFHPHLHCLVAVKKSYFNDPRVYLKYDVIRELWSKAARSDRLLQVNVRAIKDGDTMGFAEVSKYCIKPLELKKGNETENAYILYALVYTLKGTRFTQTYGVIKESMARVKAEAKPEPDEAAHMLVFHYDYHARRYVQTA